MVIARPKIILLLGKGTGDVGVSIKSNAAQIKRFSMQSN